MSWTVVSCIRQGASLAMNHRHSGMPAETLWDFTLPPVVWLLDCSHIKRVVLHFQCLLLWCDNPTQSCWRSSLALLPLGTASCVGSFAASEILYPPWFHIELIGFCVLHAIMWSSSLFLIGHLQGVIAEFSLQSKWCVFQWLQWMYCIQAVSGSNWYGQGATAQTTTPLYVAHSMPDAWFKGQLKRKWSLP
jgi:hypothetical protein